MAPIAYPLTIRQLIPTTHNLKARSLEFPTLISSIIKKRVAAPQFFSATASIARRANSLIIPTTYDGVNSGLSAGTVVAIVLGVALGTLGLVLLVWWALWQQSGAESTPSEVIEVRDRRSRSPPSRRHSRRGPEVVEIRRGDRSRSPRRATRIVEERIVEERIPRRGSIREEYIVNPRRDEFVYDDETMSSEPPRRTSYRRSGEREYVRRSRG